MVLNRISGCKKTFKGGYVDALRMGDEGSFNIEHNRATLDYMTPVLAYSIAPSMGFNTRILVVSFGSMYLSGLNILNPFVSKQSLAEKQGYSYVMRNSMV